jgi:hypothetical protein
MSSQFRLPSSQHSKAVHPGTKDNQEVVEGSKTHSAMPPADIQIKATDYDHGFEECDDDHPVKMLKHEAKENVALHMSPKRIDSCQSKRPIGQL